MKQREKKQEKTSAVVVAAGNSTRMGGGCNKQLLMLADMPVLAHTLSAFSAAEEIFEIIVVTRDQDILLIQDLIKEFSIRKVKAVIPGGTSRQESVFRGLSEVTGERVLIHDGARPFITAEEIKAVISSLDECCAAALGVAVRDTVKRIDGNQMVRETIPRENLVQVQTPQGFHTKEILAAHKKAAEEGIEVTDDCALAEYIGIPVRILPGSRRNLKITTPEDVALAQALQEIES